MKKIIEPQIKVSSSILNLVRLLLLCTLTGSMSSFSPADATIIIEVSGLKNSKGSVLVSLYDNAEHFPGEGSKAKGKAKAVIINGKATVTFKNMPRGKYAAAILHDENNNLKMDFNLVGMPKEGYGFSNNAKGTFGPPSFEKAALVIDAPVQKIAIKATYFL